MGDLHQDRSKAPRRYSVYHGASGDRFIVGRLEGESIGESTEILAARLTSRSRTTYVTRTQGEPTTYERDGGAIRVRRAVLPCRPVVA